MEKSSLRVCLISREYPPDTGFGGIATFTNHLANGLKNLGHEIHVVTLAKGKARSYSENGIQVHRVTPHFDEHNLNLVNCAMPYSTYAIGSSSGLWQKFFELHKQKPFDIVDAPELLAEGFYPAITKTVPLVIRLYTPHSKFIAEAFHNITPNFDHQFVAMVERIAMLGADAITSPSQDLAKFVANDLNLPLDQIKIIANPIDPNIFSPEGKKVISNDKELKVLFIGRLEERKGIRYLIEAWTEVVRTVPRAHLYVIGDDTNTAKGQTSVLKELKSYIQKNQLEKTITFIDRVPLSDLPAYYRSADISVVPSVYDNSPYTCLEAMSCGKAIIGTTGGGTKEYLIDGESGILVGPKNSQALAKAIVNLLQDEEKRLRFGSNARKRVMDHFQQLEIARQTAELYKQAVEIFKIKQYSKIYSHPPEFVLPDTEDFTDSFNQMLHLFLFQWSYRYRLTTWFNKLRSRPRLYLSKFVLRLIDKIFFWTSESERRSNSLYRSLEELVIKKEKKALIGRRSFTAEYLSPDDDKVLIKQ